MLTRRQALLGSAAAAAALAAPPVLAAPRSWVVDIRASGAGFSITMPAGIRPGVTYNIEVLSTTQVRLTETNGG